MLNEPTDRKLRTMKLTGMAEAYAEQSRHAAMAELSFDERFGLLVDRQWTYREDRALQTRLRHAKFKLSACLEDISYPASRGLKRSQVDALADSRWVEYHQSVILTGPTGTGKTFLACALGQKACRDGHRVRYFVAVKLFRALSAAHADGSYPRLSALLQKTELLIIDDWGLEKLQEAQYRDFLELLDDRQGAGATLLTSQYPIKLWHDTIGHPTLADAILDRLIHNAHRLELKGETLRIPRGKPE
jgi:DNA replication protein DnaC